LTVASSGSCRRPAITTEKPALTSASAEALPMPVPPPVTTATFVDAIETSLAFVDVLVVDQPLGKAQPLEIEHGRHRFERWARHRNRLAALDVIDDVANALLLEQLLSLTRCIGVADAADLRVGRVPP